VIRVVPGGTAPRARSWISERRHPIQRGEHRMELEGIVSKRIGSRYVSGRTRAWLKTKNPDFERR